MSQLGWHLFDFVRTLGRGSSGTAELVKRKADSTLLVMKVIHVDLDDGPDKNQSFDTEVRILSKLSHSHVVGYHGRFIYNNWLHILMDYCDGACRCTVVCARFNVPSGDPEACRRTGGSLEDRVREAKKNSTRFSKEVDNLHI